MPGYRITAQGKELLESFIVGVGRPDDMEEWRYEGYLEMTQALARLTYESEDGCFLYDPECLDERTSPLLIQRLEKYGYIEKDLQLDYEQLLAQEARRKLRNEKNGRWRMGFGPPPF